MCIRSERGEQRAPHDLHFVGSPSMGGLRNADFAQVHSVRDMRTFVPMSVAILSAFLRTNNRPLTIKGAGYSHGGHTLAEDGTQLDMAHINYVTYDRMCRTVRAGAGATWHDVLQALIPHNRTVAEMQSYHNFSVGGSISVNCHGRGMRFGSISDTIVSLVVLTSHGVRISCGRDDKRDLFRAVIGGYGLVVIIVEAVLMTVPNDTVELRVQTFPTSKVEDAMRTALSSNTVFFNANVYPTRPGDVVCYRWVKSQKPRTNPELVQPRNQFYLAHMALEQLARRTTWAKALRAALEPELQAGAAHVHARSFAIAEDANKLRVLTRRLSTTVLQEYFVPVRNVRRFTESIVPALERDINVINVSLRYVRKAAHCVMNYAPEEMVSFVLYFNVWNAPEAMAALRVWTDSMIKTAAALGGTFYLPYLLTYDARMVKQMYPGWSELLRVKRHYDPRARLRGMLYEHLTSAT